MNSIDEKHFLSGKKIIVAGAGIGGLTFAIALQQFLNKTNEKIDPLPNIIIYERDKSIDEIGREGYSLSIRSDSDSGGIQILHKLDILDQIIKESNPGSYFTIFNKDFSPLLQIRIPSVKDLPQSFLRISRSKLREILIKNIPSSIPIYWNCAIKFVKELENGNILVDLSNGTKEECHLLIAADGSNSLIRNILRPEHQLKFAGAILIVGRTRNFDKLPSPFDKNWGGVIGGDGHFLFIAPYDQTSILWTISYLSSITRQSKPAGTMNDNEIDNILNEAKHRTKIFSQPIEILLKETLRSSIAIFNAKDLIPFRNNGSVIFIGDAQHAMSPFAGNGANMAMMDGYQLAQQFIYSNNLNIAIKYYDDLTITRSINAINISHQSISIGHSQGIYNFIWISLLKFMSCLLSYISNDD